MKRFVVALVIALAGAVVLASPASAHAALESTQPQAGAILDEPPESVTLHFTEAIQAATDAVRVFDAARARVDTGGVEQVDGRTIRVGIGDIGDGGYVVAWKVVSGDGHPIGGAFTWRVGEASSAVDPALVADLVEGQRAGADVGVAAGIVRAAVFASLLLLLGAGAFVSLLWPAGAEHPRIRRLLWSSLVVLAIATVVGIGLQGAGVEGGALGDALKPAVFGNVLETTVGKVWLARLALLAAVAVLLTQLRSASQTWWRGTAVVLGLAVAATPALSGHADSGRWTALAKVADTVHVGAAAVWLGGLAALVVAALRIDERDVRDIAERFSPVAFAAVSVVVLTGAFQSVRQVTTLDALEISYGRLLAVKVVLVLALIGIASVTRSALRERLALDDDEPISEARTMRVLRRLVAAELVLALVVVGVTSLLVDADPGGASTATAGPFDETVVVDASPGTGGTSDVLINVVVVPGTVGPTDIHLYVDNPAGGLAPPVDATGSMSSGEITGIPIEFVDAGPGHWSAYDIDIPIAGQWELTIDVLLTDVEEVSATFTIPIGGTQ